ncbi:MAG: GatB/YqeY domain-containing protein [Candidatus Chisholmbacteria bacterium]|nr:GatB/YqeY domain-containing protein [Candidatus Chisholmbacteria bacterium]
MIEAMKAREKLKLEALRYAWSLIKNEEIEVKGELNDEQVMKVVASEVKKRKEALRQAQGKQSDKLQDWVHEEEEKLKVLEAFLPEQMSEEEVSGLVNQLISESGEKEFGKVMSLVMGKVKGKADGKLVSEVVREKLASSN